MAYNKNIFNADNAIVYSNKKLLMTALGSTWRTLV